MASFEEYSERADELAQDVVNAWEVNLRAGNGEPLMPQFEALVETACLYRTARKIANNYREHNVAREREEADERAARQAFAGAYKAFYE